MLIDIDTPLSNVLASTQISVHPVLQNVVATRERDARNQPQEAGMARSTSRTIERMMQPPTRRAVSPPEPDPGQKFIDWVLGYGYAAGHWTEQSGSQPSRPVQTSGPIQRSDSA
jgi:hypothetical protein